MMLFMFGGSWTRKLHVPMAVFLLAGSGLDVLIGLGLVSPSAMALRWFGCTQMGAI